MKTKTVMKMMADEAVRTRKTVKMTVHEMQAVCAGIAKECRTLAEARKKVEEWWAL